MKTGKFTLLSMTALALGAVLLLAPNANAEDKKSTLSSSDAKFIQEEAAAGEALVKIAELGSKKAQRADIKSYAEMLVADHRKANDELATLAKSKGVELDSEADSKHADTYDELKAESDADFDKEFLAVIISGHKKCVSNFEDAAEGAEDNDLKTWAAKMLPALQAHHKKAEELKSGSSAKAGSESTTTAKTEPDNTARNMRDRNDKTLTPLDQGNSEADIETTAQIRKSILDVEDISINAQNVKIITNKGHVTLRGPVNSAEEKRIIADIAARIATAEHTDNQLEVQSTDPAN